MLCKQTQETLKRNKSRKTKGVRLEKTISKESQSYRVPFWFLLPTATWTSQKSTLHTESYNVIDIIIMQCSAHTGWE